MAQRKRGARFRPLRGLRISQFSHMLYVQGLLKPRFRPLRGLRISQLHILLQQLKKIIQVSVPCGVFVFLNVKRI